MPRPSLITPSTVSGSRSAASAARGGRIASHVVLLLCAVAVVAPYVVELLSSLKTLPEITQVPPSVLPATPQLGNYGAVFGVIPLGQQFLNSTIVTLCRVAGQLLFTSACAYAFARLDFPGRRAAFGVVLALLMIPGQLLIIPQYQIMNSLGWVNTLQGVFTPGMFNPFGVFLMYQFFRTLPIELDEAARLDGCTPVGIFFRVLLPLLRSPLIALGVLTAVWSWNDLLWPLVIINSTDRMPLSVGLSLLQGQYATNYPLLLAGAAMATAPIIVLFAVLQRYFVAGLAASGLK